MKTLPVALAILVIALVANAVTATPSPKLIPPTSNSPGPQRSPSASPTPKPELATPMEPPDKAVAQPAPTQANNNPPPKPILYLIGTEPFTANGKNWIRLRYDVLN